MENSNETSDLLTKVTTHIGARKKGPKLPELERSPEIVVEAKAAQSEKPTTQVTEPVVKAAPSKLSNRVNFCVCMASLSVMITLLLIAIMPKIRPGVVFPLFIVVAVTFTTIMYIMKYKYN